MADFDPNEILKQIINSAFLLRVGEQTIAIIQERTLRGEFLEGSTTQGYSTKTAYMPYPALEERVGKSVWAKVKNKQDGASTSLSTGLSWSYIGKNRKWVKVEGGYRRLREITGRETDRVTLNWSGQMLSALNVIEVNEEQRSVTIRFRNQRAGEIAGFHHEGAGRSKVKRIFLGLSGKELEEIVGTFN